ncbi:hypothetical protein [Burkholderia ubonensis]|uniref:hypothetical protein n=1 Tax=Burkholderia ubonensis TaxID=101571 RepID=UPI000B1671C8|nr:hypothetical protein [Burkholderia ubonensis]
MLNPISTSRRKERFSIAPPIVHYLGNIRQPEKRGGLHKIGIARIEKAAGAPKFGT